MFIWFIFYILLFCRDTIYVDLCVYLKKIHPSNNIWINSNLLLDANKLYMYIDLKHTQLN